MKKIIVIGCPGSGKSRFSKALHNITDVPLYHLDMMFWNSDKTTVQKSVFLERLSDVLENDEWIIDGNYASTLELRIKKCDTVFFLDYPVDVCLSGVRERRGTQRDDMPWVETEEDTEFIEFIKGFNTNTRPNILELLDRYKDKKVIVFTDRNESEEFIKALNQ